jgi:FkbM family methyltransferase
MAKKILQQPMERNNMYTKQVNCRYGRMTILINDLVIGRSLQEYGEWMQPEVSFLLGLLQPGSVVLDIGAFIGTHTLAFAHSVGANGKVYAFEPRPEFFSLLSRNVADNDISNVKLVNAGMSDKGGYVTLAPISAAEPLNFAGTGLYSAEPITRDASVSVPLKTIDEMGLDRCSLIKIDAEGMDPQIMRGGVATLKRLRPIVYAECLTLDIGQQIIEYMRSLQYCVFLHICRIYNPSNFRGNKINIYGYSEAREPSLVLVPEEDSSDFESRYRGDDEVLRVYSLDDLVLGMLKWPTYKYVLAHTKAAGALGVDFFANESELRGLESGHLQGQSTTIQLQQELQRVYSSHSWRITAPLRKGSLMSRSLINPAAQVVLRALLRSQRLRHLGARLIAKHPLIKARLLRLADANNRMPPEVRPTSAGNSPKIGKTG